MIKNKLLLLVFLMSINVISLAQDQSEKFNYSAIAYNKAGQAVTNSIIGIQINILKSSSTGASIYSENHFVKTDDKGLFNLTIGDGSAKFGKFSKINWMIDNYYLKIGMDVMGTTKFIDVATTQLLIIPYDPNAKKMEMEEDTTSVGIEFTHRLGEQFGGGVIFDLWKDDSGIEHGLIVDVMDVSLSNMWSNNSQAVIGNSAESPNDGLKNSNAIVAQDGHKISAAALCLNSTNGGQTDWYLPSIKELDKLWKNYFVVSKTLTQLSGATQLTAATYWSSTEFLDFAAWYFYFDEGDSYGNDNKDVNYRVRAIRSF